MNYTAIPEQYPCSSRAMIEQFRSSCDGMQSNMQMRWNETWNIGQEWSWGRLIAFLSLLLCWREASIGPSSELICITNKLTPLLLLLLLLHFFFRVAYRIVEFVEIDSVFFLSARCFIRLYLIVVCFFWGVGVHLRMRWRPLADSIRLLVVWYRNLIDRLTVIQLQQRRPFAFNYLSNWLSIATNSNSHSP